MVLLRSTIRKPEGYQIITQPGLAAVESDTFQCCHCNRICVVKPGSGVTRGYCFMCNHPTCGRTSCSQGCEPFEAKLEAWEGRRRFAKRLGGY